MGELLTEIPDSASWRSALLAILLGYVLGQAIAAVYVRTHRGLSYSRSLVLALVASGVVAAVLMLAIGNSLARGIGIVGTMALIRFRTNIQDPLDMIFVFAAFGAGIAAGTGSHATAIMGTAVFLVVVATLRLSSFGVRQRFDGVLRLQVPAGAAAEAVLAQALAAHCRSSHLISVRPASQGEAVERVYQVNLKAPQGESALAAAIAALPGASAVSILMQEALVES